ncbi:hypothetical protein BDQ12DRAFT_604355, partial [Crucibulum laeve]
SILSILNSHKIGHHYEYYVRWKDLPELENSWVSLSDLPVTTNELIERYHCRHPRAPRPHQLILNHSMPTPNIKPAETSPIPTSLDAMSQSTPSSILPISNSSSVPPSLSSTMPLTSNMPIPSSFSDHLCPNSPPTIHENPRSFYVPPSFTTTCTGHISRPPI